MRSWIFIVISFCWVLAGQAQEQKVFYGGAYAGLSTSQLSGDEHSGFNRAGLYAGAFVNFHVSPQSAFQLELSFIQKGSRAVSKSAGLIYASNLQYVEMPVLYKWQFPESTRSSFLKRISIEAGPAIGYLIKNTEVEKNAYGTIYPSRPFDRMDYSVIAGTSIRLLKHLKFNLRFSQSFLPIRAHQSGAVYRLNRGQYNSVLAFTFHLEF